MFLNDDFLLTTEFSKRLFHDYACDMPIIDYHCHLDPKEIYENKQFKNITDVWLKGDHYKWRLMRANGVDESLVSGDGDDYSKFSAWAKTVPLSIGNPVYAWTHLELKRFFNIDLLLNEANIDEIWNQANAIIQDPKFTPRELIKKFNVKVICTTDDPSDTLEYHELLRNEEHNFKVLPTFRPDKYLNIHLDTFLPYLDKLSKTSNTKINTYKDFIQCLEKRVDFFNKMGCRLSDHGIDTLYFTKSTIEEVSEIFNRKLSGQSIHIEDLEKFYGFTLLELFKMYTKHHWTSQLHLKAYRNTNTLQFNKLGADTGYDAVNDVSVVSQLHQLFDAANMTNTLPKTIIYSLNPNDYQAIVTLMQCYQDTYAMKLQLGSGWWFSDTRTGMRDQLTTLANGALLGHFVGMLTDSRSFLSYPRHEYFRRVLCELIGEWESRGEIPSNLEFIGSIVSNISYTNALNYFEF